MSEAIVFQYLKTMSDYNASDLYLTVNRQPVFRKDNEILNVPNPVMSEENIHEVLNSILTARQKREFFGKMELNTALDMGEFGRFRVNVMRQRQNPALVIRRIISKIPTFTELKLPSVLEKLSLEKRGLVLVTGMTGSGKSTTLATMVNHRNEHETGHIITIEDPIEFYHDHKQCVVTQREVGVDTESFSTAMKNALRQRPDVLLIGEIRDADVMRQALTISETGHLCLATVHSNNSYQAIERVVNFFPEDQQNQVRMNLSFNLKAIISQRLLPSTQGGVVPAIEVMLNQGLVRECILKGDIEKIRDVMEQNQSLGMKSFDQALLELYQQRLISDETAISNADKPSNMKVMLQQVQIDLGEIKSGVQPDKHSALAPDKAPQESSSKSSGKMRKIMDDEALSSMDTSRISLSD